MPFDTKSLINQSSHETQWYAFDREESPAKKEGSREWSLAIFFLSRILPFVDVPKVFFAVPLLSVRANDAADDYHPPSAYWGPPCQAPGRSYISCLLSGGAYATVSVRRARRCALFLSSGSATVRSMHLLCEQSINATDEVCPCPIHFLPLIAALIGQRCENVKT